MNRQNKKYSNQIHQNQKGFTIVELMIATAIFSTILLMAAAGLMYIGRLYYKGIISSRTQGVARAIIDDITRPIQFSGSEVIGTVASPPPGSTGAFCIDNNRYTYTLNAKVTGGVRGLWQDERGGGPCDPADASDTDGREMLSQNMRLKNISVVETSSGSGLWEVKVGVIYGDDDLIEDSSGVRLDQGDVAPERCISGAGSQWCALSELSTIVRKRL